jgi:uncharacterized glyoxalase superfamily protein PhnB
MPGATVIPTLPCADVLAAAAWLERAFGFRLRLTIGDHRAQMAVGDDGAVVLTKGEGPASVMVRVPDVDVHHRHAVAAGAETSEPATFPYGERQYSARDPDGHVWTFSQSVDDIDPASWGGSLR